MLTTASRPQQTPASPCAPPGTPASPRAEEGERAHVRGVGDELPQKDLLVGVEGVDDERHELGDLRLEGERLRILLIALHLLGHLQGKHSPSAPQRTTPDRTGPCPASRTSLTSLGVTHRRKRGVAHRPPFIGTAGLTTHRLLPP